MILKHKAEFAGRVKLQISGGKRGTIDYPWFGNMVLDQGLNMLINQPTYGTVLQSFYVGSSSQPVSPSDVGVIAPIAVKTAGSATHGWDGDGGFGYSRATATFARGVAAGNISEVAAGWDPSYSSAAFRALVKDASGEPTTITVLSDEVLSLTWEVRRWWTSPPPHLITYDDGDGGVATTTVSYKSVAKMSKSFPVLGSAGTGGWVGSLVAPFTGERTVVFAENAGNPAIGSATPPMGSSYPSFPNEPNYVTFTPPIPKTSEFTVAIVWQLTVARREP